MSHGAKGEALRDRFLIMTSDLEIFPDGFFLRSFIELDEYSEDRMPAWRRKTLLFLKASFFESIISQES